ncbi:MAG: YitT family protein [Bacilli bacterium]|nr:YitT family protein [Bacilli bacterium]
MFKKKKKTILTKKDTIISYIGKYLILLATMFVSAVAFNLLQRPLDLVTGGVSGITIIINNFIEISPSQIMLVTSVLLLLIGVMFLDREKIISSLVVSLVYPFFVEITTNISTVIKVDTSDQLLIALFLGIISGVTTGINLKTGLSTGGFNIISQAIYKFKKISISKTSFLLNGIVVIIGGLSFGSTMVMYAIIVIYISNLVTDRILIGISKNKSMYILTKKEKDVEEYILNVLGHGVTEFNVKGGYELNKKHALMTVIPNSDYFKLKEGIRLIDETAFIIIMDSYQLMGGE